LLLQGDKVLALSGSASNGAAMVATAKWGLDGHEARSPKNVIRAPAPHLRYHGTFGSPFGLASTHYFTEKTCRLVILFDY
jgi:hypothetical protein